LGLAFVNRMNESLALGAGALLLEGEKIRSRSRVYALAESAPERARLMSMLGIVANTAAHQVTQLRSDDPSSLDDLALQPEWVTDRSGHPVNHLRASPDEMLTIVEARFYPDGRSPAPASLDLGLDRVALILEHSGIEAQGGEREGALVASWQAPIGAVTMQLDRVYPNPYLGYGFHASLTVTPDTPTMADALETAQRLNEMEATLPVALIGGGAWSANPEAGTLTYAWFHPNGGLLGQLAMLMYGNLRLRERMVGSVLAS
jgi:hypothetical protein